MGRTCEGEYGDEMNGVCSIMAYDGGGGVRKVMCVYLYGDRCDNEKRDRDINRLETYGLGKKICGQRVK